MIITVDRQGYKQTTAVRCDSDGDHLSRAAAQSLDWNGPNTRCFWGRLMVDADAQRTIHKIGNSGGTQLEIYAFGSTGTRILLQQTGIGAEAVVGSDLEVGRWYYHSVVRRSNTSLTSYINGVEDAQCTVSIAGRDPVNFMRMSDISTSSANMAFCLYRDWEVALTPAELMEEMRSYWPVRRQGLWSFTPIEQHWFLRDINGRFNGWTANGTLDTETGIHIRDKRRRYYIPLGTEPTPIAQTFQVKIECGTKLAVSPVVNTEAPGYAVNDHTPTVEATGAVVRTRQAYVESFTKITQPHGVDIESGTKLTQGRISHLEAGGTVTNTRTARYEAAGVVAFQRIVRIEARSFISGSVANLVTATIESLGRTTQTVTGYLESFSPISNVRALVVEALQGLRRERLSSFESRGFAFRELEVNIEAKQQPGVVNVFSYLDRELDFQKAYETEGKFCKLLIAGGVGQEMERDVQPRLERDGLF